MANASLNIPITGDASALIAEVNRAAAQLKKIQEEFNNAFTTKGKKLKVQIDETLIEGSIADLKQKLKSLEETRANISPFDVNALKAINIEIKTTQDEIKRLQNLGVKRLEILPPPGSIDALKKELADLIAKRNVIEPFRIEHLTDVARRIAFIKDEIKRIEGIGVEIKADPISPVLENSIAGLQEKLNKLRNAQINIDIVNEKEIAQTNDEIKRLESEILRLKGLSIDPNGKLTQSSAKARQAITSLSLVAQDLPFGFIAIQNNLPAVLQTFTELETKNKGLKGTFKELGSALVGPAGFFLAFSAITGAVTYLVKEYGSLSNAYMALTTSQSRFTDSIIRADKSLKDYLEDAKSINEIRAESVGSVEKEIIKVNALAKVLSDSTSTDRAKKGALADLKKASEEYFGEFKQNAIDVDKLNSSVAKYTEGLIKNAVAQGLATEAGAAFAEFLKLNQISVEIANEINNLKKVNPKLNEEIDNYLAGQERILASGGTGYKAGGEVGRYFELSKQLSDVNEKIKGIVKSYDNLKKSADLAYKEAARFIELPDPTDGGKGKVFTPTIDSQALDEAFNLDTIISNLTKYGNALIDVNNTEKERKNALRELLEINPEYFASFDLNKNRVQDLKGRIEAFIRTLLVEKKAREDAAAASKINTQLRKAEEKGIEKLGDKYNIFNGVVSSIPDTIEKAVKISFDFEGRDPLKQLQATTSGLEIEQGLDGYISKFKDLKEVYADTFPELIKKNKEIADSISSYLTQPLTDVFDILLKDGEKSWKDFGDTVIDTLKRIAVQLAITAIAKTISNILAPGTGTITEAAADAYFRQFGSGLYNQANFGTIRGERSVAMSGQVNMVIRGSDLVGAMNRTNSTISRVG